MNLGWKTLWLIAARVLLPLNGPLAQSVETSAGVQSINGCTGSCNIIPGTNLGTMTLAQLASVACDNSTTKYGSTAYITDLGGGANMVKCVNGFWTHLVLGFPASVAASSGTVTVTALASAPIQKLTSTIGLGLTLTISMSTTNLYPGYQGTICPPSSLLGTLLFSLAGVNSTLLGSACHSYVINSDGTSVTWLS